jgi:hypothetical protein
MQAESKKNFPAPPFARLTLWLFLSLLVLYVIVTRGHFWSTDEVAVYQQTRSLWEHGDLFTPPLPNSLPGRGGRYYAVYGAGQSLLALPLYGLGKATRLCLEGMGAQAWIETIAGRVIGDSPDRRWGGDVEIFFVNLFNAITVAALASVFFVFSLRLGARPKWVLAATLILALTSHIAGFGAGFFQHGAESLFVLCSLYFLFCDSRSPNRRDRLLGGIAAGAMLLVRINTGVLLPALTVYLCWNSWKRLPGDHLPRRLAAAVRQCLPFLIPVAAGILLVAAINDWKFGEFSIRGAYAHTIPFNTPLLVGLYGNLFSVGQSILLFSPVLALAPFYFQPFARRYRAEAAVIIAMAASSLLLDSKIYLWHGQWCFGPRYLVHIVPLLLLPLAAWLQEISLPARLAVVPFVLAGLLVEVLHVAVNVSYVYYHEGYLNFTPPYGYLFLPESSQLAAHWRALWAWDYRVDMWLVNVARQFGPGRVVAIGVLLLGLLSWCVRRLVYHLRRSEAAWAAGAAPAFAPVARAGAMAMGVVWLMTVAGLIVDRF